MGCGKRNPTTHAPAQGFQPQAAVTCRNTLPLPQHSPHIYSFHKFINLNVFFINPNGFRLTGDGQKTLGK